MAKLLIENRYAVTPNHILQDKKLTLKAKGLWTYIQSKPDGWNFAVKRMISELKEGEDSITSAIKELEHNGYLIRNKYREKSGKWGIEYILVSQPGGGFPGMVEPGMVEPYMVNHPNQVKNINKEIEVKNNIYIGDKKNKNNIQELINHHLENKNEDYKNIFLEFLDMRKKLKAINSATAIKQLIKKINGISENPAIQKQAIIQSIEHGRKTIYPLAEKRIDYKQQKQTAQKNIDQSNKYKYSGASQIGKALAKGHEIDNVFNGKVDEDTFPT